MKNIVLTDTGYWLALANRKDKHHRRAIEATKAIDAELFITWPVATETCYLISTRLSPVASIHFLEIIENTASIFELTISHIPRIQQLMKKYQELPMDLADASLVIAAESLEQGDILSTDRRDFNAYRWKNRKPFNNLLLPGD